jgi:hypothetical protein
MSTAHVSMDEVLCFFEDLEDPRSEINRKHPLVSVVVIAIMGVLAQATGPTGIATWAKFNADFLATLVPLPHGVPGKDVFRRVLCALRPDAFQTCFSKWIAALRARAELATGVDRPTFAVDGKTLRRSHNAKKGLGPLHSVSVWASECGITLARNRSRAGLPSSSKNVRSATVREQGGSLCASELRYHRVDQVLVGVAILQSTGFRNA